MDPNGRRVDIHHVDGCRCVIDGDAIYVVAPCVVIGHHVTKRRISQLLHSLRKQRKQRNTP